MGENEKLVLDASSLTTRDMIRARVALGGKSPWEMMEHEDDAIPLTIWCLKSRIDPKFTWDDALDTPIGDFEVVDDGPPESAPPSSNGSKTKRGAKTESNVKQPDAEAKSSSATTSD